MPSTNRIRRIIPRLYRGSLAGPPPDFGYFVRTNAWFFSGFLLLLIFGLYLIATRNVGDLVLLINRQRTSDLDEFFVLFTQFAEPRAYLVVVLFYLLIRFRTAIFAVGAGAVAGIISAILKGVFQSPRPLRWFFDNANELWYQLVLFDPAQYNNSWAYTSFPSGHAMSAFALYAFIAFNAGRYKHLVGILCLIIAAGVGFSRIYLLMHFMKDITVGASLGVIIAAGLFYLQFRMWPNNEQMDRGLFYRRPEELPPPTTPS